MKINKVRLQLLMQNSFFVILFLILVGLVGFLTHEYHVARDITQSNRNILTDGSVNILKQMKGEVNITVFASEDNTAHSALSEEKKRVVTEALNSLDQKYKDIIELRFYEEKSYEEIADILRIPPGTVATHLNRIKKILKEKLHHHVQ